VPRRPALVTTVLVVALIGTCASASGPRAIAPPRAGVIASVPAVSITDGDVVPLPPSPAGPPPDPTAPTAPSTGPGPAPFAAAGTTRGTPGPASQPAGRGYVDARVENALPGTPGWQTSRSAPGVTIAGFADTAATTAGPPVGLHVASTARTFRIQLLRLGWYGGAGARQVWLSVPVPGGPQPGPRTDPATRRITAPWHVSAVLPTGGLVAGDYVAKLVGSDGASSFVPLVVREATAPGTVLMLNSTLTWQAYNTWGGGDSYGATGRPTKAQDFEDRSVVSSYDRPYHQGAGSGGLFGEEYDLVVTAERLGLRLNYAADVDLHSRPDLLAGAAGVAVLGHSEYWSRAMRAALTAARDGGTNLAFLGANDVFRRIRLQPSPLGPDREMVNYKDGAADPVHTPDTTADWPRRPFPDPESSLTGVQYRCAHARADLVVTDPQGWLFAGLGLHPGQRLPGLVGSEYDRVSTAVPTPRPMQIMAHSPVPCYGTPDFSDLVWYTTPSGAGVFAAGTMDWQGGMTAPDALTRTVVTAVTERVFTAIAHPAAGRAIPAVDNVGTFYTPTGTPRSPGGPEAAPAAPSGPDPAAG